MPPDDLENEEQSGRLDTRIRQIIGDHTYELVWKSVYRSHSRVVDRMQGGRVLVAGDPAHLVSPFAARGLNSGLLDAENAAWKLAFVLRGWAPALLFTGHHDERHAAALENLAVTGATMCFLVPQDDAAREHQRQVLERSRTDIAARALVDSGRLAEPFWYVDSPLTTPDASRPFAGRPPFGQVPSPAPGALAPDCPLSCADRPELERLRLLLRQGTVLVGDDADVATLPQALTGTAPVDVRRMRDLDEGLAEILGARPDEAWLLRTDVHVAAVVPAACAEQTVQAVRRLVALPPHA